MKRANIIFGVCAVLWMVVIFCFSAADGNESSKTSGWVGRMIGHIFVSGFDDMTETEQEEWASKKQRMQRNMPCLHCWLSVHFP